MKSRAKQRSIHRVFYFWVPLLALALGILAWQLATPRIGRVSSPSPESIDRRNAQSLVSVCGACQAAGWDWVAEGEGDLGAIVNLIVRGHVIDEETSPFNGTLFAVPNLDHGEQKRALKYLAVQNGMLIFLSPP